MTIQFSSPFQAHQLRLSLKRGLARQALSHARNAQADHGAIFAELHRMSPNRRGMERTLRRLRKATGVVSAGISGDRVVLVLRNACTVLTRLDQVEAFSEDALIYSRATLMPERRKVQSWINRVSFSHHALERLVERGGCDLNARLLVKVDAEAVTLLKKASMGDLMKHDGDDYLHASGPGVWAGSMDMSTPEPEWRIAQKDACIPTFSARTFLGPDEMKPAVWLRWQDDPRLSLAG